MSRNSHFRIELSDDQRVTVSIPSDGVSKQVAERLHAYVRAYTVPSSGGLPPGVEPGRGLGGRHLVTAALDYMHGPHEPVHYQDLYRSLVDAGIPVSGENPSETLLAALCRDERIKRAGRGRYVAIEVSSFKGKNEGGERDG